MLGRLPVGRSEYVHIIPILIAKNNKAKNKVSDLVDPEATEAECYECGEAVEIADEEQVMDAIVRHYQDAREMLTTDG